VATKKVKMQTILGANGIIGEELARELRKTIPIKYN
jgi:hypothetical protein